MRIAVIPARGGSQRVPRKNVRPFAGKPMLSYPLELARESHLFNLIVVSTDDDEITQCAFDHGAVVVPRPLDDGELGTQEIAARVLDQLEAPPGVCCVIYPCTPLLDVFHVKQGHAELLKPHHKSFVRAVGPDGQDAGAFYWGWTRAFRDRNPLDAFNTQDYVLPAERVCDVNTWEDFHKCETMFEALRRAP